MIHPTILDETTEADQLARDVAAALAFCAEVWERAGEIHDVRVTPDGSSFRARCLCGAYESELEGSRTSAWTAVMLEHFDPLADRLGMEFVLP
jgi:hypothetical protein